MCDAKQHRGNRRRGGNKSRTESTEIRTEKKEVIAEVVENSALTMKEEQPQLVIPQGRNEMHAEKKESPKESTADAIFATLGIVFLIAALSGTLHGASVFVVLLSVIFGALFILLVVFRGKERNATRTGHYTGSNEMRAEVVENSALAKKEAQPQSAVIQERKEMHAGKKERPKESIWAILGIVIILIMMAIGSGAVVLFLLIFGVIFGVIPISILVSREKKEKCKNK